jgi:hypothetical protein
LTARVSTTAVGEVKTNSPPSLKLRRAAFALIGGILSMI